jgi:nitrite reductase/ring-hydroxylating ferredoxin subunit
MPRIRVCSLSEIEKGEVKQACTEPPVAIYNIDGEIYATGDICSHDHFHLSDGYVDGDLIECSLHFAQFCVKTGQAVMAPATEPIPTYPVDIVDGEIYVEIPKQA